MLFSFRLFVIFLFSPFLCSLLARVPFRCSVCHPSLAHLFFNHSSHDGNDIYMYLRELDSRCLLEWWNTSETWGNVMQINDKSEMVDVNKNLTRRKNWKGGGVFCEAKGFRRPDRHPIWNFSSAAITDTAICNFGRDSTVQTFIYPPIYPPRSIHSDYL